MNDAYVNALNTQKATQGWMDAVSENMVNIYTPGYRESKVTFKTFLDSTYSDTYMRSTGQGKATPGTSDENVFLEGAGFFVLRNENGKLAYTRLGEFKFDGDGVYKAADGSVVQGYIMNDKGEIVSGTKSFRFFTLSFTCSSVDMPESTAITSSMLPANRSAHTAGDISGWMERSFFSAVSGICARTPPFTGSMMTISFPCLRITS